MFVRLCDLVRGRRGAFWRRFHLEDNFAGWPWRSLFREPVPDEAKHEVVCVSVRERALRWLEAVVSVARFATDRVPAVGRAREELDASLRRPRISEHPRPDVRLNDFEYVVQVVPSDVLAAQDREDLLDVRILSSEVSPFAGLRRRSDKLDDLDLPVGPGSLDVCVDLAVKADRGTHVDEVLLRTTVVNEDGGGDAWRVEPAELDVEGAGSERKEGRGRAP
jgi:hypothetical protein